MDHGIARRIRNGFGANIYGQVVTVIVQLVGVPILLHAWGVQLYGEWLILFAIPAYLSMTDLGFSQSAANDMTAQVARGDRDEALAVFQSLGALVFSTSAAGFLLVTLLIFGLPLQQWMHFQAMSISEVRWVLWLLAVEVLMRLSDGISHAGFRANGEYAFHVSINTSTRLLQYAAIWLIALEGGGVVAAAAGFTAVQILAVPATALVLAHKHSWLRYGFNHARWQELSRLSKPALANIGMPLAQSINIQGMILVVGSILGPLAVVTFSTLRTMTRLAFQLVLAASFGAEPEFAFAHGKADVNLMRVLFSHVLRASFWLASVAVVFLVFFGSYILKLWTHGLVIMDTTLFHWLLISATASVFWQGPLVVLKASNRHINAAFTYCISAGTAVLLGTILLHFTGRLSNIGLALLIMDVTMAIYTFSAVCNQLRISITVILLGTVDPRQLIKRQKFDY